MPSMSIVQSKRGDGMGHQSVMDAYVDNRSGMNIKQDFDVNLPKPKSSLAVQQVKRNNNYKTSTKTKFYELPVSALSSHNRNTLRAN